MRSSTACRPSIITSLTLLRRQTPNHCPVRVSSKIGGRDTFHYGLKKTSKTALRSSEDSVDSGSPFTLSAYDQLVLSVRAMSVKEIQNELKTRAVSFDDCFEKSDLVGRLVEARLQVYLRVRNATVPD
jgi:hypothetical protein